MEIQVVRREGNAREKRWKMEVQEVHEMRWIFKRCKRYTRDDMEIQEMI